MRRRASFSRISEFDRGRLTNLKDAGLVHVNCQLDEPESGIVGSERCKRGLGISSS